MVAGHQDGTVTKWEREDFKRGIANYEGSINAIEHIPELYVAIGTSQGKIYLWDEKIVKT